MKQLVLRHPLKPAEHPCGQVRAKHTATALGTSFADRVRRRLPGRGGVQDGVRCTEARVAQHGGGGGRWQGTVDRRVVPVEQRRMAIGQEARRWRVGQKRLHMYTDALGAPTVCWTCQGLQDGKEKVFAVAANTDRWGARIGTAERAPLGPSTLPGSRTPCCRNPAEGTNKSLPRSLPVPLALHHDPSRTRGCVLRPPILCICIISMATVRGVRTQEPAGGWACNLSTRCSRNSPRASWYWPPPVCSSTCVRKAPSTSPSFSEAQCAGSDCTRCRMVPRQAVLEASSASVLHLSTKSSCGSAALAAMGWGSGRIRVGGWLRGMVTVQFGPQTPTQALGPRLAFPASDKDKQASRNPTFRGRHFRQAPALSGT